jgi:hypothetical protein
LNQTKSERVDDLPVVIQWLSQMRIEQLIDQELPEPHGNRQGLSYGQLAVLLLSYIVTSRPPTVCCRAAPQSFCASTFVLFIETVFQQQSAHSIYAAADFEIDEPSYVYLCFIHASS